MNIFETDFIQSQLEKFPGSDPKVLKFIQEFSNNNTDKILDHFNSKYCYYFAVILKDAFGKGEVCWTAPNSHIVWSYNNIEYDIYGVNDDEYDILIPVQYMGELINDFKYISLDVKCNTSEKDIQETINIYKNIIKNKDGINYVKKLKI